MACFAAAEEAREELRRGRVEWWCASPSEAALEGRQHTSESSPGACSVEEPSKFQIGRSSTDLGGASSVLVLQRSSPLPPTQMYSAITCVRVAVSRSAGRKSVAGRWRGEVRGESRRHTLPPWSSWAKRSWIDRSHLV